MLVSQLSANRGILQGQVGNKILTVLLLKTVPSKSYLSVNITFIFTPLCLFVQKKQIRPEPKSNCVSFSSVIQTKKNQLTDVKLTFFQG